jgi:hypothetical protein
MLFLKETSISIFIVLRILDLSFYARYRIIVARNVLLKLSQTLLQVSRVVQKKESICE